MNELPSKYNPRAAEEGIYSFWENKGYFHAAPDSKRKPYSIVIPPPNITGILHIGHALNNTLQDILIRWKRMQGNSALWMPGTDHAGIATQNVVEKKLAQEHKTRDDLGREKFLEEVWKWREEYGSTIIRQLKKLGASCDWERLRFTMDAGYSRAVSEVFISLWNKGLVYQGNYIINWCPRCQTALSDEEAPHHEREGFLYYIKYPIKSVVGHQSSVVSQKQKTGDRRPATEGQYVVVATTRPETMLGDVAVAVNPRDKRHKALWSKTIILPLLEKEIKIIKDDLVDPKFGTGAVKVTPAHDPNDFAMGTNHKLAPVLVMNPDGTMNENAGEFKGMDRFEAREAIIETLKERGLILKIEEHTHAVGHCYRCNTMIEPYLSRQWFVKMKPLAKPAIQAVKKGKVQFYPARWTKVYLNWMENIRDWCISRQIWWGHRIPVYYCRDCEKEAIAALAQPEKCRKCGSSNLKQDDDVLDTWFSSWLWPFATFGWPDKSKDRDYFYPTSTLVTAPEILFFWVARMIMAGMEFMNEVPFKDVYIHGTVRDLTGKKMSKSLGNIIDPLDIINEFGTDALRFSIISITATGQDVFLSKDKFTIGRNFANKIWNASRFVLMNLSSQKEGEVKAESLADKWILSRLNHTIANVTRALEHYRFNDAANSIYEFFWHEFCDWYLELVKPVINEAATQSMLIHVLDASLRLLHPFMPFISEEIWQKLPHQGESIMVCRWPKPDKAKIDNRIEEDMALFIDITTAIRNIRAEMNIPAAKRLDVFLSAPRKKIEQAINNNAAYIRDIARLEKIEISKDFKKPRQAATAVVRDVEIIIPLKGIIDLDMEKERLAKQIRELEQELAHVNKKLKNKQFLDKAPPEIVSQQKDKKEELRGALVKLKDNLKRLG